MSNFNEFLSLMAKAKKEDPVAIKAKEKEDEIKQHIKEDLGSLFSQLSSLKKDKQPEHLTEYIIDTPIGEVPELAQIELVGEPSLDRYLKAPIFNEPKKPEVDVSRELKLLSDKFKFMEQWIGKIANAGPGSGAAEIYNLDMPTKVVTGDYTVGRKDYYVGVNADVKTYITLPTAGGNLKDGRVVVIKDESGHAQLTPIKLIGTIDNDPNGAEIRINNGAVQLIYRNGSWRII
jgi:hypothetical protein